MGEKNITASKVRRALRLATPTISREYLESSSEGETEETEDEMPVLPPGLQPIPYRITRGEEIHFFGSGFYVSPTEERFTAPQAPPRYLDSMSASWAGTPVTSVFITPPGRGAIEHIQLHPLRVTLNFEPHALWGWSAYCELSLPEGSPLFEDESLLRGGGGGSTLMIRSNQDGVMRVLQVEGLRVVRTGNEFVFPPTSLVTHSYLIVLAASGLRERPRWVLDRSQ